MPCASCQQRREAIARIAREVGTIVFGGKRVLAGPVPPPQSQDDDGKR